jgi:hypothetical protein
MSCITNLNTIIYILYSIMDDQLVQSIYFQKMLPIEIIYMILIYLRQPQDAILLKDISHYYN